MKHFIQISLTEEASESLSGQLQYNYKIKNKMKIKDISQTRHNQQKCQLGNDWRLFISSPLLLHREALLFCPEEMLLSHSGTFKTETFK